MACSTCGGTVVSSSVSVSGSNCSKSGKVDSKTCRCDTNPFIPSCETQQALAQCVKTMFCDLLRCVGDAIEQAVEKQDPTKVNPFVRCLETAVVSFAECVPDALCGPKVTPPPAQGQLPCEFAVEDEQQLSVSATKPTWSSVQ